MSLNFDLTGIEDYENRCWVTATEDAPMSGVSKGDRVLNPVTNRIVWATMAVGIGSITEETERDFYARVRIWDAYHGFSKDERITPQQVRDHIGLRTNVTRETDLQWVKRVFVENSLREGRYQFDRAMEREEGS